MSGVRVSLRSGKSDGRIVLLRIQEISAEIRWNDREKGLFPYIICANVWQVAEKSVTLRMP